MKRVIGWLLLLILLGAAGFAFFLWQQGPTYRPLETIPEDAPPSASAEPAERFPLPDEANANELPPLSKSDPAALAALADVFGKSAVGKYFQPQEVVRRVVVTIDNLPRKTVSGQLMPTKPIAGKFRATDKGQNLILANSNFDRYTPYVRLLESMDTQTFMATYVKMYPLFQQAYKDLGYPKAYFNDRLVGVIDHMLEAPPSDGPIALKQPHVFYKFVDPELESRSAGHKLMLRVGNENTERIKAKLREIRKELTKGVEASAVGKMAAPIK
jgi:hypothetical protein